MNPLTPRQQGIAATYGWESICMLVDCPVGDRTHIVNSWRSATGYHLPDGTTWAMRVTHKGVEIYENLDTLFDKLTPPVDRLAYGPWRQHAHTLGTATLRRLNHFHQLTHLDGIPTERDVPWHARASAYRHAGHDPAASAWKSERARRLLDLLHAYQPIAYPAAYAPADLFDLAGVTL